jgi:hypothetical protein
MLTLQVRPSFAHCFFVTSCAGTALLWHSHPLFVFTLLLPAPQLLCSQRTKPYCEWQEEIFK